MAKIDRSGQVDIMPHDEQTEMAVLGAAIDCEGAIDIVCGILLSADVFYKDSHKVIYAVLLEMYNRRQGIDSITVVEALRKSGKLDEAGGMGYVLEVTTAFTSIAHVEEYCLLVKEKHVARELVRIGKTAQAKGYDPTADAFDSLDKVSQLLSEVAGSGIKKKAEHIQRSLNETVKKILDTRQDKRQMTGIGTGIPDLNKITKGLQAGELIILAARPSVGKTAFLINLLLNIVCDGEYGGPAAAFSLEMMNDALLKRALSCAGKIKMERVSNPSELTDVDIEALMKSATVLGNLPLYLYDKPGLTIEEFRVVARELVRKHGVKVIAIDYLQLMEVGNLPKGSNREQAISMISRELKKIALELQIPIIALSQMSRGVDQMDREPELSDLRESGAIEQDADVVGFLYRPNKKFLKENPHAAGKIYMMIKKHRNGALGDVLLDVDNSMQRWTGLGNPDKPIDRLVNLPMYTPAVPLTGYQAPSNDTLIADLPF